MRMVPTSQLKRALGTSASPLLRSDSNDDDDDDKDYNDNYHDYSCYYDYFGSGDYDYYIL